MGLASFGNPSVLLNKIENMSLMFLTVCQMKEIKIKKN